MGKRHGDTIFFLAVFLALTGLFFALPPLGLQSNAEGSRYVQMKNFHLNGSLAIPYPGEALGFGAADFVRDRLFLRNPGRGAPDHHSRPVFSWLSSFFYPLFGERVVHFLPLLSLFLALVFMARTLGQVMDRGPFYFILLGIFIVSPILWHIFGFTEHTGAVFLLTGGLYFLTRYFSKANSPADLFLAFLLTGASVFLVPGFVIALAALTLSCAIVLARERKGRDLALVFLGGLLPVFARALHEQTALWKRPGSLPGYGIAPVCAAAGPYPCPGCRPLRPGHFRCRCRPGGPQAGCQIGILFHGDPGASRWHGRPFFPD